MAGSPFHITSFLLLSLLLPLQGLLPLQLHEGQCVPSIIRSISSYLAAKGSTFKSPVLLPIFAYS